jgi:16S rRNA (uracil1498-N3)-methyltransferase
MRHSRVHTPQTLSSMASVELSGQVSHYLTRVLRLSEGDSVTLFNGDGRDYSGKISEIQRQCVMVALGDSQDPVNESALKITLVQAISRGERMDYCLQKATELGVSKIQLLTTSRVEVRLNETRLQKRMTHWQAVVTSACEQSGRAVVPKVRAPLTLLQWLDQADEKLNLVFDPSAKNTLSSVSLTGHAVSVLVGPEGGFSKEEIKHLTARAVEPVSLGPRVLRSETAGPAAIAVLQALAGDF